MVLPLMRSKSDLISATIANGASLSDAIDMRGRVLCGIYMPAAWTAAGLSFQASADGSTWSEVYTLDGEAVALTAAASVYLPVDAAIFAGASHIKVRSGTSGAAVNQGAERIIGLVGWDRY